MVSRQSSRLFLGAFLLAALAATPAESQGTRFLRQPTLSQEHVAFTHGADLWVVGRDGGLARRLTSTPAVETDPHFSPDGRHIAFTSNRSGVAAVYVVPVEGGTPRRLTWYPAGRLGPGVDPRRRLGCSMPPPGRPPRRATPGCGPCPHGAVPRSELPAPWGFGRVIRRRRPAHRRGAHRALGRGVARLPRRAEHAAGDPGPGRPRRGAPSQRAHHRRQPGVDGRGHLLPLRSGLGHERLVLRPGLRRPAADHPLHRRRRQVPGRTTPAPWSSSRTATFTSWIRPPASCSDSTSPSAATFPGPSPDGKTWANRADSASLSATGKRALFEARGEIFTVPAEKGDPRNLTRSSGAADRAPIWSPDGRRDRLVLRLGSGVRAPRRRSGRARRAAPPVHRRVEDGLGARLVPRRQPHRLRGRRRARPRRRGGVREDPDRGRGRGQHRTGPDGARPGPRTPGGWPRPRPSRTPSAGSWSGPATPGPSPR